MGIVALCCYIQTFFFSMGEKTMNMNEFLEKHGRIQSDNAWIFPDDVKANKHKGKYVLIGFEEVPSSKGKDIPVLKLQDTESKVTQMLSLWSTDQSSVAMLELEDVVTLREIDNKVFLNKVAAQ